MATFLFHHPDVLRHDVGSGHPERPDRIRALMARLDESDFKALVRHEAPEAERAALERAHPAAYLDMLADLAPREPGTLARLDQDGKLHRLAWTIPTSASMVVDKLHPSVLLAIKRAQARYFVCS